MSVTATGYVLAAERPPRQQSNWTQLTLIVGQQHTCASRFLTCGNLSWTECIHKKHRWIFFIQKNPPKTCEVSLLTRKRFTLSVFYNSQQRRRHGSNRQKNNDLKWPQNFLFFWLHMWVIVHLSLYKGILLCNCFLCSNGSAWITDLKSSTGSTVMFILCNEKYVEVEVFKGHASILITNETLKCLEPFSN